MSETEPTEPGDSPDSIEDTAPEQPLAGATTEGGPPVAHANQLRGARFRTLIRKPLSWGLILGISLAVGILFSVMGSWVVGLPLFVIVALIGVLVVFFVADSQAEDAFYDSYCENHGLTRVEDADIAELTPLLRKGDERKTHEIFRGPLGNDVTGDLVLYTYTEVTHDHKGNRHESNYPFTMIHIQMPEIVQHLPELRVQNQSGFKFLEGLEDKFRANHIRVTLESEAMRDRYEIFVLKGQDPIWVRRLFSPSFIVWLTEKPPYKFAFELEDGHLIAYIPKHMDDIEGLERISAVGTYVASRLLTEVAQTSPKAERELA